MPRRTHTNIIMVAIGISILIFGLFSTTWACVVPFAEASSITTVPPSIFLISERLSCTEGGGNGRSNGIFYPNAYRAPTINYSDSSKLFRVSQTDCNSHNGWANQSIQYEIDPREQMVGLTVERCNISAGTNRFLKINVTDFSSSFSTQAVVGEGGKTNPIAIEILNNNFGAFASLVIDGVLPRGSQVTIRGNVFEALSGVASHRNVLFSSSSSHQPQYLPLSYNFPREGQEELFSVSLMFVFRAMNVTAGGSNDGNLSNSDIQISDNDFNVYPSSSQYPSASSSSSSSLSGGEVIIVPTTIAAIAFYTLSPENHFQFGGGGQLSASANALVDRNRMLLHSSSSPAIEGAEGPSTPTAPETTPAPMAPSHIANLLMFTLLWGRGYEVEDASNGRVGGLLELSGSSSGAGNRRNSSLVVSNNSIRPAVGSISSSSHSRSIVKLNVTGVVAIFDMFKRNGSSVNATNVSSGDSALGGNSMPRGLLTIQNGALLAVCDNVIGGFALTDRPMGGVTAARIIATRIVVATGGRLAIDGNSIADVQREAITANGFSQLTLPFRLPSDGSGVNGAIAFAIFKIFSGATQVGTAALRNNGTISVSSNAITKVHMEEEEGGHEGALFGFAMTFYRTTAGGSILFSVESTLGAVSSSFSTYSSPPPQEDSSLLSSYDFNGVIVANNRITAASLVVSTEGFSLVAIRVRGVDWLASRLLVDNGPVAIYGNRVDEVSLLVNRSATTSSTAASLGGSLFLLELDLLMANDAVIAIHSNSAIVGAIALTSTSETMAHNFVAIPSIDFSGGTEFVGARVVIQRNTAVLGATLTLQAAAIGCGPTVAAIGAVSGTNSGVLVPHALRIDSNVVEMWTYRNRGFGSLASPPTLNGGSSTSGSCQLLSVGDISGETRLVSISGNTFRSNISVFPYIRSFKTGIRCVLQYNDNRVFQESTPGAPTLLEERAALTAPTTATVARPSFLKVSPAAMRTLMEVNGIRFTSHCRILVVGNRITLRQQESNARKQRGWIVRVNSASSSGSATANMTTYVCRNYFNGDPRTPGDPISTVTGDRTVCELTGTLTLPTETIAGRRSTSATPSIGFPRTATHTASDDGSARSSSSSIGQLTASTTAPTSPTATPTATNSHHTKSRTAGMIRSDETATPTVMMTVTNTGRRYIPIPAPKATTAAEEASTRLADAVGGPLLALGVFGGGGGVGGQLGVANAMARMALCDDNDNEDANGMGGGGGLPILVHPLQFTFPGASVWRGGEGRRSRDGEDDEHCDDDDDDSAKQSNPLTGDKRIKIATREGDAYIAAALSNTVIVPLAFGVLLRGVFYAILRYFRGQSHEAALTTIGWPTVLALPITTLGEGIGVSIIRSFRTGSPSGMLCGAIATVTLLFFIAAWVRVLVCIIPRERIELSENAVVDVDGGGGGHGQGKGPHTPSAYYSFGTDDLNLLPVPVANSNDGDDHDAARRVGSNASVAATSSKKRAPSWRYWAAWLVTPMRLWVPKRSDRHRVKGAIAKRRGAATRMASAQEEEEECIGMSDIRVPSPAISDSASVNVVEEEGSAARHGTRRSNNQLHASRGEPLEEFLVAPNEEEHYGHFHHAGGARVNGGIVTPPLPGYDGGHEGAAVGVAGFASFAAAFSFSEMGRRSDDDGGRRGGQVHNKRKCSQRWWRPPPNSHSEESLSVSEDTLERYGDNALGDKRFYYAEITSFACSLLVGVVEGVPATYCRPRAVVALIATVVQCLCSCMTLVPLELGLQLLLSICVVPMAIIVVAEVLSGGSRGGGGDDAIAVLSLLANGLGLALLGATLLLIGIGALTTYRHHHHDDDDHRGHDDGDGSNDQKGSATSFWNRSANSLDSMLSLVAQRLAFLGSGMKSAQRAIRRRREEGQRQREGKSDGPMASFLPLVTVSPPPTTAAVNADNSSFASPHASPLEVRSSFAAASAGYYRRGGGGGHSQNNGSITNSSFILPTAFAESLTAGVGEVRRRRHRSHKPPSPSEHLYPNVHSLPNASFVSTASSGGNGGRGGARGAIRLPTPNGSFSAAEIAPPPPLYHQQTLEDADLIDTFKTKEERLAYVARLRARREGKSGPNLE